MRPFRPIDERSYLKNDERWDWFLAGWSCGMKDCKLQLRANKVAINRNLREMIDWMAEERPDTYVSRETEQVFETRCRLELLGKLCKSS